MEINGPSLSLEPSVLIYNLSGLRKWETHSEMNTRLGVIYGLGMPLSVRVST